MPEEAPRPPSGRWRHRARGARRNLHLVAAALALLAAGTPGMAQEFTEAEYKVPTRDYPHAILGDDEEWAELHVTITRTAGQPGGLFEGYTSLTYRVRPPGDLVYEDVAPRLWDVTGDGKPEVVVVESDPQLGARLAVIGIVEGKPHYLAVTPHIGTRFRWLAPVGAADLDMDGNIEIAFVDRPHVAQILRVWRYAGDDFFEIATMEGMTNHRIGEDYITGGVRDCGDRPEILVVDTNWQWIMVAHLTEELFVAHRLAPFEGPASVDAALTCD